MTDVRMRMRRQDTSGPTRLLGSSHWLPTRAVNANSGLLLPASMTVNHTASTDATVRGVEPCAAEDGWCWVVTTWADGVIVDARAVLVPDLGTVVEYEDLDLVDPRTLDPTNISQDAWEVLRNSVIDARDQALDALTQFPDGAERVAGTDLMRFTRGGFPVLSTIELPRGPRGLPGVNAVENDEAIAAYIQAGDSETSLAGDVRWVQRSHLAVNVRDYGATGDGETDDSDAFNAAIGVLAANGGGELYIPPGTYWCRERIQLTHNMTMTGYGATMVRRLGTGEEGYTVFRSIYGHGQGYGKGLRNFTAQGLTFRGTFAAGNERHINGFSIFHGENITLRDLTFIEAQSTGHCIDLCGCKNVVIDNVRILGMMPGEGNYQRAEAIQVDAARVSSSSSSEDPADEDGLPCVDVVISNVHTEAITVGGTRFPAANPVGAHSLTQTDEHRNVTIRNVSVVEPQDWVYHQMAGLIHFVRVDGLTVESVSVDFAGKPAYPIVGLYGCDTGLVDNVTLRNMSARNIANSGSSALIILESVSQSNTGPVGSVTVDGLKVSGPSDPAERFVVVENRIGSISIEDVFCSGKVTLLRAVENTNVGTTPGAVSVANAKLPLSGDRAIYVENAESLSVTNCAITTSNYNAIYVTNTDRVAIVSNLLEGPGAQSQVVWVQGEVGSFVVNNNTVKTAAGQRGLRIEPELSSKGTIVGNTVYGGTNHQIITPPGHSWTVESNAV